MKKNVSKFLAVSALAFSLLTACDSAMYTVGVQPTVPVYERPVSPNSGYVWVEGDWVWEGGRYQWHNGYWTAPRARRTWVGGRWEQRRGGYTWRRGHWN
jgi:hypothetical protein